MKILIDAMGGDHAPKAPVLGAIEAVKMWGTDVILVGREDEIRAAAKEAGYETLPKGIEIVHAPDVVDMHDDPANVCRKKKDSSMVVGLRMLSEGQADAMISAGSTGALPWVLPCPIKLVARPSCWIAAPMPNARLNFCCSLVSWAASVPREALALITPEWVC